jgi:hypothetical protein
MAIPPNTTPPLLDFDVQGAFHFLSDQGLSVPDATRTIAQRLAQQANFDADAAFDAGFTSEQVISKLTGIEKRPGAAFLTEAGKGVGKGYLFTQGALQAGRLGAMVGAIGGPGLSATLGIGAGIGGGLLGIFMGEEIEDAFIGDADYLPSDLRFAEAGETLGQIAGGAQPMRQALKRIPGVAQSAKAGRGRVDPSRALSGPETRYVDFGAAKLMQNAARTRERAARMRQAAKEHGETVVLNPRTGRFEPPTGAQRLPGLGTRAGAAGLRGLGTAQSAAGKTLGWAERQAVEFGRIARDDPRKFYAVEGAMATLAGTGRGVAEAVDPGDPLTGFAFETVAMLSPAVVLTRALPKAYNAARHPIETAKTIGNWSNERRSRMAREYIGEIITKARERDPNLPTASQLADEILEAARTRPEASLISPGQLTGNPALILLEANQAAINPQFRQQLKKMGEAGLAELYNAINLLRDTGNLGNMAAAIEIEREIFTTLLESNLQGNLGKAAEAIDKFKVMSDTEQQDAGTFVKNAVARSLDKARAVERSLYQLVDPNVEIVPTNTLATYKDLFGPRGMLSEDVTPNIPVQVTQYLKKFGAEGPSDSPQQPPVITQTPRQEDLPTQVESLPVPKYPENVTTARSVLGLGKRGQGKIALVFQRDEDLRKLLAKDPGQQIAISYKASPNDVTAITGWDELARLFNEENFISDLEYSQLTSLGDFQRAVEPILLENRVHPRDQERVAEYNAQEAEYNAANRDPIALQNQVDAPAEEFLPNQAIPTTLGEMMKFRRTLRQAAQQKGAGMGSSVAFDAAVLNKLQSAALKDIGGGDEVRALVNDPTLNYAIGNEEFADLTEAEIRAAQEKLAATGISENAFKLARAYTYSRLLQNVYQKTIVGEKLLQRRGLGDERFDPETALNRIFTGPVTLHLQQLQEAMEFLQPGGIVAQKGFPRFPPVTKNQARLLAEEGVESDPVQWDVGEMTDLTLPPTEAEMDIAGVNNATVGFLRHMFNNKVLRTRQVESVPAFPEAAALNVPGTAAERIDVPTMNPEAYRRFMEKNSDILNLEAFSTLKADLDDVNTQVLALNAALEEQSILVKNAQKEYTLSRVLGVENPGIVFSQMVASPNPEKNINGLIKRVNHVSAQNPDLREDLNTAVLNAAVDYALRSSGGARNFDFQKFYDYLFDTKRVAKSFSQGEQSAPIMTILENGGIVEKEMVANLKDIIGRAENIQLALRPGGMGIENVVDNNAFKLFVTRYIGATAGARVQQITPGSAGSIQIPGFGASLATEILDRTPRILMSDILIGLAQPGNSARFADFLRLTQNEEQNARGLQRLFDYIGSHLLATPLYRAGAANLYEEQTQEEYVPAPPVQVSPLPDMQPSPASPSMQQVAAAPAPAPAPQQPSAPMQQSRSQYAAMFPNDPISDVIRQQQAQGGIGSLMPG